MGTGRAKLSGLAATETSKYLRRMAEIDSRAQSRVGALVCLYLKQANSIVELLSDGLLLVFTARGTLKGTKGIAVVSTDISDIRVKTTAQRCIAVANTSSFGKCWDLEIKATLGGKGDCFVAVKASVHGLTLLKRLSRLDGGRRGGKARKSADDVGGDSNR